MRDHLEAPDNFPDIGGEQANDWERASSQRLGQAAKDEKKRIKALERDLARKEKALAEAVALLVLRKNAAAIWGGGGGARSAPQIARTPSPWSTQPNAPA